MKTTYSNIESSLGWLVVSGPSINSVAPTTYVIEQTASQLRTYISGPAYAGALGKKQLPLPPIAKGIFTFSFEVEPDEAAELYAQALEFDLRVSIGGLNYNGSFQINYAEGGMCQIVDASGKWVDTGIKLGILPANTATAISVTMSIDQAKKTFSVEQIGALAVPQSLQNVPASNLGWADCIVVQIQCDLNSKGGAYSHGVQNVTVEAQ